MQQVHIHVRGVGTYIGVGAEGERQIFNELEKDSDRETAEWVERELQTVLRNRLRRSSENELPSSE